MTAKIDADLSELRHQHRLLSNIAVWYLAPIGAVWLIVILTMIRLGRIHARPGSPTFSDFMGNPYAAGFILLYFVVIVPLVFWGTWFVNRRAARRRILPRIEELEKLRRDLSPTDQDPTP
jgi:uncharacterized membrane protein